jgi:hypothetical protein
MGLDIFIKTDSDDKILTADYFDYGHGLEKKHRLSRTFCSLITRWPVIEGEPELDQIGKITFVDISPISQMGNYTSEEELEFLLEVAESEEERQQILNKATQRKESLAGNIDKVLSTVSALIEKLSWVENLPRLLDDSGRGGLKNDIYFADFNICEGAVGDNFGRDLRNFKSFLEYAKEKGATTVHFTLG